MPKISSKSGSGTNIEGTPVIAANSLDEPKQTDTQPQVQVRDHYMYMYTDL